jgi:hypothetical protein
MTELFRDLAEGPESASLTRGLWARRALVTLLAAVSALALADVFGQVPSTSSTAGPAAGLAVEVPNTLRGGLLFQARVDIRATQAIAHPRLVFARGWLDGLQVSSIEPGAVGESSRDGRLVLSYDALAAGDRLELWMQFQVDPTALGHRDLDVELDDATRPLARLHRTLTILP